MCIKPNQHKYMSLIPTQHSFFAAMQTRNLEQPLFRANPMYNSWPNARPVTWPELLDGLRKSTLFSGHRLEIVRRDQNYEVNSRSIDDKEKQVYEIRIQVACWDSAWLRALEPMQCARALSDVVVRSLHDFAKLSSWTVFGSQVCSFGLVDVVRVFAGPLVAIPDLPDGGRAVMGRTRILTGLSLQLPLRSVVAAFPPSAMAVIRLRAHKYHHGLSSKTLAKARADLLAVKKKLGTRQREHHVLAQWVAEMTGRAVIQRLVRVPISLLAHLVLDKQFHKKRKEIFDKSQMSIFGARVRTVRESFGDQLLIEETPPKDRVAVKVIVFK